jgi:hypothetical protein
MHPSGGLGAALIGTLVLLLAGSGSGALLPKQDLAGPVLQQPRLTDGSWTDVTNGLAGRIHGLYQTIKRINDQVHGIAKLRDQSNHALKFEHIHREVQADAGKKAALQSAVETVRSRVKTMEQGIERKVKVLSAKMNSQFAALRTKLLALQASLKTLSQSQAARKNHHHLWLAGLKRLPTVIADLQASMDLVYKHGVAPKGFDKLLSQVSDIRASLSAAANAGSRSKHVLPQVFTVKEGIAAENRIVKKLEFVEKEDPRKLKRMTWRRGPQATDLNTAIQESDAHKIIVEDRHMEQLAKNRAMTATDMASREEALSREHRLETKLKEDGNLVEAHSLQQDIASDQKLLHMDQNLGRIDGRELSRIKADQKNRQRDFRLRADLVKTERGSTTGFQKQKAVTLTTLAVEDSARSAKPQLSLASQQLATSQETKPEETLSKKLEKFDRRIRKRDSAERKRSISDMHRRQHDEKLRSVDRQLGQQKRLSTELIKAGLTARSAGELRDKMSLHAAVHQERFALDRHIKSESRKSVTMDRDNIKADRVDQQLRRLDRRERKLELRGDSGFDRDQTRLFTNPSKKPLLVSETTNDNDGSESQFTSKLGKRKQRTFDTEFLNHKIRKADVTEHVKDIQEDDMSKEDIALRRLDIKSREKLLDTRGFRKIEAETGKQGQEEQQLMKKELKADKQAIKNDAVEKHVNKHDEFRRQHDKRARKEDEDAKEIAAQTRGLEAADIVARVVGRNPKEMMQMGNAAAAKAGLCKTGVCTLRELQAWSEKAKGTMIGPLEKWSLAFAGDDKLDHNIISSVARAVNVTMSFVEKLVEKHATAGGFCAKTACSRLALVNWAKKTCKQQKEHLYVRKQAKTDPMLHAFAQALVAKPEQDDEQKNKIIAAAVATGLSKPASLLRTEAEQAAKAKHLCKGPGSCTATELHVWAKLDGAKQVGALGIYARALGESMKDNVPNALAKAFHKTPAELYSRCMRAALAAGFCLDLKSCSPANVHNWASVASATASGKPHMSMLEAFATAIKKDSEQDGIERAVDDVVVLGDRRIEKKDLQKAQTEDKDISVVEKDRTLRRNDKSMLKTIEKKATRTKWPGKTVASEIGMLEGLDKQMRRTDSREDRKEVHDSLRESYDRELRKLDIANREEELNGEKRIKIIAERRAAKKFDRNMLPALNKQWKPVWDKLRRAEKTEFDKKDIADRASKDEMNKVAKARVEKPPAPPNIVVVRVATSAPNLNAPTSAATVVHVQMPKPMVRAAPASVIVKHAPLVKEKEGTEPFSEWIKNKKSWTSADKDAYEKFVKENGGQIKADMETAQGSESTGTIERKKSTESVKTHPEAENTELSTHVLRQAAIAAVASGAAPLAEKGPSQLSYHVKVHHPPSGSPFTEVSVVYPKDKETSHQDDQAAARAAEAADVMKGYQVQKSKSRSQRANANVNVNVQAPPGFVVKADDGSAPVKVLATPVDTVYE